MGPDARTSQVAAGEDHEVEYFAKSSGMTKDPTLELIKKHGSDRQTLHPEAAKLKGK